MLNDFSIPNPVSRQEAIDSMVQIGVPRKRATYFIDNFDPFAKSPFISLDQILEGRLFERSSTSTTFQDALDYAGSDGIVTMPEWVVAQTHGNRDHPLLKRYCVVHSEELVGIDQQGKFYEKGTPLLVVIHGCGLITSEHIEQAYAKIRNANGKLDFEKIKQWYAGESIFTIEFSDREFDLLLEGKLPSHESVDLYRVEDIDKISHLSHRFGIVMPYALAQNTHSGDLNKKQYLENPLAMARAGSLEHLEAYFDKANSNGTLRNLHPFEGKEVTTSQSCLLTMYYDGGMSSERGSFYTYTPLIGVTPKGFAERMIG